MKTKWTIWVLLVVLCGCASTTPPEYMRSAAGVRIFLPDNTQSFVLTPPEASGLLEDFNGRLFANGRRTPEAELRSKRHVLSVAYPLPGDGETHIHVYADGTVGYIRTMRTYQTYPMGRYCAAAIRLAEKHGLMTGRGDGANKALQSDAEYRAPER